MDRKQVLVALVTALALGIGALVLQRWVAQTFQVAVALVVIWFGIVTAAAYLYQRDRPDMRLATLGTIGLVGVVSAVGGYWTGVRKDEVNEQVVVASTRASGEARTAALTGMASGGSGSGASGQAESKTEADGPESKPAEAEPEAREPASRAIGSAEPKPAAPQPEPEPADSESDETESQPQGGKPAKAAEAEPAEGPVELAIGQVAGADGHAGQGTATVVEEDGKRILTLTEFDVDAGPDVDVYLSQSTEGIDEAINLGDLKGERGNQEYEIPADVDLTRYDDLVLWCIPFTTRIATAELR